MDKQELLELLKSEGFSIKILKAFSKIKRENFIPLSLKPYAYLNEPLPIGKGATISQPYTIAFMLELLELNKLNNKSKILEIGSGCGYVLALLDQLSKNSEIYGIEINPELVKKSKQILKQNKNIKIINKNGSNGLKEKASFDRILVSAEFDRIPTHLYSQLKNNGILVTPVKNSIFQIKKINKKIKIKEFPGFIFVPLIL